MNNWKRGTIKVSPKKAIINTDTDLKLLAEIPNELTSVARNKVKNVKLKIKPTTTPIGLRLPSPAELERIIGNIGKIHGESMVTTPAKNENVRTLIIT